MNSELYLPYMYIKIVYLHNREDTVLTMEGYVSDCHIKKTMAVFSKIIWKAQMNYFARMLCFSVKHSGTCNYKQGFKIFRIEPLGKF